MRPEGSVTLTTWHLLSHKLAITSPTSGGRSVGIVRSRTQTLEFFFFKKLHRTYFFPGFSVQNISEPPYSRRPRFLSCIRVCIGETWRTAICRVLHTAHCSLTTGTTNRLLSQRPTNTHTFIILFFACDFKTLYIRLTE
jgi:hypothetical protein